MADDPLRRWEWRGALLALLLSAAPVMAQPVSSVSPAEAAFTAATGDYVAMHRRLERLTGPITLNSSVESINRSIQALAAAIRSERPDARQGDFFTSTLAGELRARVNEALISHDVSVLDVPGTARPLTPLRVNDTFPWALAAGMISCLSDALPPLPSELQYRIVGNDLVLIDVHASLVVDILPNVLADITVGKWLTNE